MLESGCSDIGIFIWVLCGFSSLVIRESVVL